MNVHHVVLVVLCCVCMCVCDSSNTVSVVATSLTPNPADCDLSKCPDSTSCTRAFFSDQTSLCFFLHCESNESCERYISDLGNKTQTEEPSQNTGADPLQLPSPSPKSPVSLSLTAPPPTLPASAIPSPRPVPLPVPEEQQQQRSVFSSNTSQPGFSSKIKRSSQDPDQGRVQNNSSQNEHQGQPPVSPSTPALTSPLVPVASASGGKFSTIFPEVQNGSEVNKTGQETTTTMTTSTTSVKPALHTNTTFTTTAITTSTTTTTTSTTTTSAATTTTSTTTTTTSTTTTSAATTTTSTTTTTSAATTTLATTTNKVTPPPSTTQTQPTSTPTPPPSPAPPFLPSVTPSTPAPGHNHSTTASKALHVTSNQDKAIAETPGGELRRSMLSTSSLITVLIFGLLFFFVTVILFLRHAYESYKRRGYTQMDYLINGMYSDSGL